MCLNAGCFVVHALLLLLIKVPFKLPTQKVISQYASTNFISSCTKVMHVINIPAAQYRYLYNMFIEQSSSFRLCASLMQYQLKKNLDCVLIQQLDSSCAAVSRYVFKTNISVAFEFFSSSSRNRMGIYVVRKHLYCGKIFALTQQVV